MDENKEDFIDINTKPKNVEKKQEKEIENNHKSIIKYRSLCFFARLLSF